MRSGILLSVGLCRSGVRAKFGVDMGNTGDPVVSRSLKSRELAQDGNIAGKTCRMEQ